MIKTQFDYYEPEERDLVFGVPLVWIRQNKWEYGDLDVRLPRVTYEHLTKRCIYRLIPN